MAADHFETQKNIKASGYTLMVCVLLLIIMIFVKWTIPDIPPPPDEEGIEVNLGNSDQGLGDNQAFLPGKPAPHAAGRNARREIYASLEDVSLVGDRFVAAYLKDATAFVAQVMEVAPKWFGKLPKAKLEVRAVEAWREATAAHAAPRG